MANGRVTSSHLLRYTAPVNPTCEAPTREGRETGIAWRHSTAQLGSTGVRRPAATAGYQSAKMAGMTLRGGCKGNGAFKGRGWRG